MTKLPTTVFQFIKNIIIKSNCKRIILHSLTPLKLVIKLLIIYKLSYQNEKKKKQKYSYKPVRIFFQKDTGWKKPLEEIRIHLRSLKMVVSPS